MRPFDWGRRINHTIALRAMGGTSGGADKAGKARPGLVRFGSARQAAMRALHTGRPFRM